jgi:hypothetical protein
MSTIKTNAIIDAAGGNTATVNGTLIPASGVTLVSTAATQTLTNKTLTSPTITGGSLSGTSGVLTSGTAQSSASGTSVDFTSIPSWVKRVTVMFLGVSTSVASEVQIQLGDSGGIENTGYTSSASQGTTSSFSSTGLVVTASPLSSDLISGIVTIANITGNTWVSSGAVTVGSNVSTRVSGGSKTLSATLDRLSLVLLSGGVFDAGTINIMYEG